MATYKTRLGSATATFDQMMKNGFGVVTVMNAKVYNALDVSALKEKTAYEIYTTYSAENLDSCLCTIDTFKVANVTQEGPTKTVTGGQYSNPLIKFGKSARLEMQDALGRAEAIDALCGGVTEYNKDTGVITGLHFGEDFVGPKMIIGDSFFIDRKTGEQVKVGIIFYQFLPDSIFNLTQDAEGEATVFDMNGDLLTTEIIVGDENGKEITHGLFYSIVDPNTKEEVYFITKPETNGDITLTVKEGYTVTIDNVPVDDSHKTISKDTAARIVVKKGSKVVYDEVIKNYK